MGFIILSFTIVIVIFAISTRSYLFSKLREETYCCPFIIFAGIILGLFLTTGGYKPVQEVQTLELHALSDQSNNVYFSVNDNEGYTFYTQTEVNEDSQNYIAKTIKSDNVTIIEEENCETPRVTEYCQKSNISFWSFGIGDVISSYVFYVPKGTISLDK